MRIGESVTCLYKASAAAGTKVCQVPANWLRVNTAVLSRKPLRKGS